MSKKLSRPRDDHRAIDMLYDEVNKLSDSVNQKMQYEGSYLGGKSGDFRFSKGANGKYYLEAISDDGIISTVHDIFKPKPRFGYPDAHFEYLTADNFFAYQFTVKRMEAIGGQAVVSDGAVVESATKYTITFEDPTGLNLCPFAANDKIVSRVVKADNSLDVRLVQATVDSVSGATCTVTYNTATEAKAGDIFIRTGNSSDSTRQNVILLTTIDTYAPYIDLITGQTGFTFGTPTARFGKLDGITDEDFGGAITGFGIYAQDVYLKGSIIIANPGDINASEINNDAGWTAFQTYRQASEPESPNTNELWYDTTNDILKRYTGAAWEVVGAKGTYIDGTGVYTGTVAANQVVAGTMTGFTIQTASSGQRVEMSNTNQLTFYNSADGVAGKFTGYGGWVGLTSGNLAIISGTNYFSMSASTFQFYKDNPTGTDPIYLYFDGTKLWFGDNTTGTPDAYAYRASADMLEIGEDVTVTDDLYVGDNCDIGGDLTVTGSYGLAASDIPNLDAGKITTGTFNTARIPTITYSMVDSSYKDIAGGPLVTTIYVDGSGHITEWITVDFTFNNGLLTSTSNETSHYP